MNRFRKSFGFFLSVLFLFSPLTWSQSKNAHHPVMHSKHSLFHKKPVQSASVDVNFSKHVKNWGLYLRSPDLSVQNRNHASSKHLVLGHIHALQAWKIEKGNPKITVAVVDTGIDPYHPDLRANLWRGTDLTIAQSHSKKSTRWTAASLPALFGWDFVLNKKNPQDIHGHGTHVAGIIAAQTNLKSGTSGVAPGVRIMPVRYYFAKNSGMQNLKNTIRALKFAIAHGARIINYSGGGPEFSSEEFHALQLAQQKGILVVCAAGNEGKNTDPGFNKKNEYFPAAYVHYGLKNIISVASINSRSQLLSSSNWGTHSVDLAAPGENILSTLPGGNYGYMTGTSQATAFVTGTAALLLSHDSSLTVSDLRTLILSSVDKVDSLKNKLRTGGKLNAYRALKMLLMRKKEFSLKAAQNISQARLAIH